MPLARGRQARYSEELARSVLQMIASGWSLERIAAQPGMPSESAIWGWQAKRPEFRAKYYTAYAQQADRMAEQVRAIADEPLPPRLVDEEGRREPLEEWKARLAGEMKRRDQMIEARKWRAATINPAVYGNRQHNTSEVTVKLDDTTLNQRLAALLAKAQAAASPVIDGQAHEVKAIEAQDA